MAKKKRTTISDIAKALGISITTVSFILNGKSKERRISAGSTKRVLDYVKKIGYKPSQLVRNTSANQTKMLAVMVDDISNPFFSAIGKSIEKIAAMSGFHVIHFNTENDTKKAQQLIQFCIDKEIDGVMMAPCEDTEEAVLKLKKQHIPVVLFDRFLPAVKTSYVISDNRTGAYAATKHLLEMGSGRVGLVSLYSNQTQMRGRLDGYMEAIDEFQKQPFIRKLNIEGVEAEIESQIVEFMVDNKLEAVLFANSYLAIRGMKAAKEQAIGLPNIVVFGDHELFSIYTPTISVVEQHTQQLATELMQTLVAEMEDKLEEERKVVVPCTLIVRESSTSQPV